MVTRELPRAEWSRLTGTELESVTPFLHQDSTRVLVVEVEGQIVGCWALMTVLHVEGIWIHPTYRRAGSVARRLLSTMRRWIGERDAQAVVTAAIDPDIARFLERLGASAIPGQAFIWPMTSGA